MGLRVVPVLHCVWLALRVVLSWFGNAIDSGETIDARQAAKHTPGGGTADSRPSRRELLEFPKISKRTKRPFFVETLKPKRQ